MWYWLSLTGCTITIGELRADSGGGLSSTRATAQLINGTQYFNHTSGDRTKHWLKSNERASWTHFRCKSILPWYKCFTSGVTTIEPSNKPRRHLTLIPPFRPLISCWQ